VVPGGGVDKKWVSDQVSVGVVGLGHVGGGCIELGIHGGSEGFGHNIQSKKLDEEYSFSNEKLDFPQVIILDV